MCEKKQSRWVATLSLVAGLALAACGGGDGGAGTASAANSTAANSAKPGDSGKTADAKKSADKPADTAKPADSAKAATAEIDVDAILDSASKDGEASGALKVNLDGLDDKAPSIGAAPPPAPKAGGAEYKWLSLGLYMMPDMGMEKRDFKDGFMLAPKDGKSAILITTWKDPKDVEAKVKDLMTELKIKDFKWKEKFKAVTLGPDKIPAKIAGGHAVREDGKEGDIGYVLIKGEPNILGVLIMKDGVSKEEKSLLFSSVAFIKNKPK